MSVDALPPLRDVIARHDLRARKSLGQNFLMDLNLTGRIARVAGSLEGANVFEVGPGPGGLTRAILAEGAKRVVAVEADRRCMPALAEIADVCPGRLTVIEGDALSFDPAAQFSGEPFRIIANLPYNVGTALVVNWLTIPDWPPAWQSLTLMFQKEVAERIVAAPGSKTYGRLSVLAQWRSTAKLAFALPARAFTPPPKVDSAIVQIAPTEPLVAGVNATTLERITAMAFGQRRKMLRSSLKELSRDIQKTLQACDINPTRRAEELTVAEFCRIAAQVGDE